jgi:hypothetical protein
MPPGIQANNLSPMGFGQPNMARAAASQGGPGYGMPQRPVPQGQQPRPQAPPGGAGAAPKPTPFTAQGIPSLYASPMGQQARQAKPEAFPADAVYNRVQQAILNPGPPRPTQPPPAPPAPPMGMGTPVPPPLPQMAPPAPPGPMGPLPQMGPMGPGPMGMLPGPMGPAQPGGDMAAALQFMQQQLGGGPV